MDTEESDRYRAPALDKGLDILELLASVDGGLTQAEISKRLNRSPNEFYRMLDRLVRRGYVTRIDGDRYSLTLKLFGLSQLHAPVRRLASYATPLMRDLAQRSKQANHLAVFDRGSAVTFLRDGVVEPKLRVNSTKYQKATAVVANVTIAGDAPPDAYDVMVTTASGKKGIGTERFTVLSINIVAGANVFLNANAQGQAVGIGCDTNKGNTCRPVVWNGGNAVILPMPAGSMV